MALHKKQIIAFIFLITILCSPLATIKCDAQHNFVKLGKTICIAGISYGTGCLFSALFFKYAAYKYHTAITLFLQYQYNEQLFYKNLKQIILTTHNRCFFNSNKYRNYPLLNYKRTLDWYIQRLYITCAFQLPYVSQRTQIMQLIKYLKTIRKFIEADYDYHKEKRRFEERN